jgi:hypothetical protein
MPASTCPLSEPGAAAEYIELSQLAADIQNRHRSWVRELRIEAAEWGVVLRGRAVTYYGKQVALHEVLQCGLAVVANEIVVSGSPVGAVPF